MNNANLEFVVATPEMIPEATLPQVAFAGRSNVGKSSLINALTGRKKLARTSSTPGKTQQIFFYRIDDRLHFVDLPGYGYAQVSRGQRAYFRVLVDRYLEQSPTLRTCVLLLDPRRPVGEEEISFIRYLAQRAIVPLVVFTKWDRVRSAQRSKLLKTRMGEFAGAVKKPLCVSTRTGEGLELLERALQRTLEDSP